MPVLFVKDLGANELEHPFIMNIANITLRSTHGMCLIESDHTNVDFRNFYDH
jgi:hypothetical protein